MTAYTLFRQGTAGGNAGNPTAENFGCQFAVSQACALTGIWWSSPSGADALPDACAIYVAGTQALVAGTQNSSPSWSGAAASGWVKCTYSGSVILSAGTNYVVVVHGKGVSSGWYGKTTSYWTSGAGASGVTNGPLSAPDNAAAVIGQDLVVSGASLAFPSGSSSGSNYWVDVEVTPATAGPALLMAGYL